MRVKVKVRVEVMMMENFQTYVFSTTMPCGPSPKQNSRPFPTIP